MKKIVKSSLQVLGVICALFVSVACAGAETKTGLSVGVGGGLICENFDTGSADIDFDKSSGFDFKLGYRFNDHFEGEIDYLVIDGFDVNINGVDAFELDGYAVTASAKYYPLTGKVQPYGLIGAGYARLETTDKIGVTKIMGISKTTSDSDFVFRAGAGVDVSAAENVLFFAEASYYFTRGDLDDLDFIPVIIGARYKF